MSASEDWLQQLPQNIVIGLEQGSMYSLIALGYTLVYGVLQLINFAHSEVFMSGGFGSYLVVNGIVGHRHLSGPIVPLTILAGVLSGALTGAAIAWLLEKVAYKTLRRGGAPKLAFLISAIGASLFLSNLAGKLFNRLPNNAFPTYFNTNYRVFTIGSAKVSLIQVIIVGTAIAMMVFLDRLVNRTKLGRGIRAVAEDAPTAALMGIDIDKTISRTFVIGGALAGAAGFMFGTAFGVSNLMGFTPGRQGVRRGGARRYRQHPRGHDRRAAARAGRGADRRAAVHRRPVERRDQLRRAGAHPAGPPDRHPRRAAGAGGMNTNTRDLVRRLIACLFGGVVLAMMVGSQEGTLTDFGISFREAVLRPRIVLFLLIGVVIFTLITFWPLVVPYLTRPGITPLGLGVITVLAAQTVMNWYDPLASSSGSGKFSAVASIAQKSPLLSSLTVAFFGWLAWTLLAVALVGCGAAIVTRLRPVGYVAAVVALAGAVLAYVAHHDVVNVGGGIDHSLGMYADIVGFGILVGASITAVHSRTEVSDTRGFVKMVMDFRPGLPLAVLGIVLGLLAFLTAGWFGALGINYSFSVSHTKFEGTAISSLASQYLAWLGLTLFAASALLALAATWLRDRRVAWAGFVVSAVGVLLTFLTLHSMTTVAAKVVPQYGAPWKNLGAGGFLACIVFSLFAAAMSSVISTAPRVAKKARANGRDFAADLPVTSMITTMRKSTNAKAFLIIAGAIALFYPPTLPVTWQNVLVSQIGVFVLLAIGLNVVVGWAGLLDLGYIAFYEIGSYTTAYLVGALPVKPPNWLHMPALLTIPFAIVACLIAGVLLGAPTLRLRGDYLAIVTLGFGEIIQIVAVNNPGQLHRRAAGAERARTRGSICWASTSRGDRTTCRTGICCW